MIVKIDTKAHFTVFTLGTGAVHANMAGELEDLLGKHLAARPHNIILVVQGVSSIDAAVTKVLKKIRERAEAAHVSFVIAGVSPQTAASLGALAPDGFFPVTRTLTEAIDLVMMEELERDLGAEGPEEDERME
jgi:anti-anti-sigma regulatory factor